MANPERGEVEIAVRGRAYTLALDLNALCAMQYSLRPNDPESVSTPQIFQKVGEMNAIYLRAFVWALLRRHHKEITLDGASDLVTDAGGIETFFQDTLSGKLSLLRQAAEPDARDRGAVQEVALDNGHPTGGAVPGTGTRSTSKHAKSGSAAMISGG